MATNHGVRFERIVDAVRTQIAECTIADVVARQKREDQFVLVDVREDREFNAARIPGAVHIGKGVIERDIEEKFPTRLLQLCFTVEEGIGRHWLL